MIKNQQINIYNSDKDKKIMMQDIDDVKKMNDIVLYSITKLIEFVKLPDDYIFLDLGTNLGWVTDKLLKHNIKGEIHCFEPHPVLFKNLKEKYKDSNNVFLNEAAVSNTNGEEYLYFKKEPTSNNDDGSSLNINKSNISGQYKTKVKVIKLSDYISKFDSVDVLKMDIEGAEYDVLNELIESGAIHKIKYIFYECHERKVPLAKIKKEVLTKLTNLGIKTYKWL